MSPLWLLVSASSTVPFLILLQPPCFLAVYGTLQAGSCLQTPAHIFPLIKELSLCPDISMTCFLISFRSLQNCHLLIEAITEQPIKVANLPPPTLTLPISHPCFLLLHSAATIWHSINIMCIFVYLYPSHNMWEYCKICDYCLFYSWLHIPNLEQWLPHKRFFTNICWMNEIFKSLGLFRDVLFAVL